MAKGIIKKVSKGKNQSRITVPKSITSEYVLMFPVQLPNVQEVRKIAKKNKD